MIKPINRYLMLLMVFFDLVAPSRAKGLYILCRLSIFCRKSIEMSYLIMLSKNFFLFHRKMEAIETMFVSSWAKVLYLTTIFLLPIVSLSAPLSNPSNSSQKRQVQIIKLEEGIEFINEWYVCGPFPKKGSDELRAQWASGKVLDTKDHLNESVLEKPGKMQWINAQLENTQMLSADPQNGKIRPLEVNIIDFQKVLNSQSTESSAYALAFISSATTQTRSLFVGSDDGITLWLNGRQIHKIVKDRPIVPDEDFVIAKFRRGLNILFVEVTNTEGYWGFMLRISSPKKHPFTQLYVN